MMTDRDMIETLVAALEDFVGVVEQIDDCVIYGFHQNGDPIDVPDYFDSILYDVRKVMQEYETFKSSKLVGLAEDWLEGK